MHTISVMINYILSKIPLWLALETQWMNIINLPIPANLKLDYLRCLKYIRNLLIFNIFPKDIVKNRKTLQPFHYL